MKSKAVLRRFLMSAGIVVLLAGAASPVLAQAVAQASKPNIVYIVADDMGWKDVGYHGSDIKTPTIDRLAETGAIFEQFYAQPMCTPTRASLMTGRYPFRYGLQTAVILSAHTYGVPVDEYLLPQTLKDAGYDTAIIGKWHLGHGDKKYWPRQRGFDYQYGPLIGELDYFTHEQHHILDWFRNNEPVREEGYTTTLLGNDAVTYITGHDTRKPMYLYLTFNAPHTPYQATKEYLDKYSNVPDANRRAYAGAITAMDDQVARVLSALDQKQIRDNTLVVFQSDNGGVRNAMFAGEGDMSKVVIPNDNGLFRDGKGSLYEGGTRVVAVANWPGKIKPGTKVEGAVHVVDMYPTLANLAGASLDKCKTLDGLNIWPALAEGKPSPRKEVIYNIEPFRAGVREGDWKLVLRSPLPESVELFNIATDPYEKTNVAAANPEIVAKLRARANELASQQAKSLLLQTEFGAILERLKLPPALPGADFEIPSDD